MRMANTDPFGIQPFRDKRVVLESPYAPSDARSTRDNLAYFVVCMRHSMSVGERPFASHGVYTLPLDDANRAERRMGIEIGLDWATAGAEAAVYYTDFGWSAGMRYAFDLRNSNVKDGEINSFRHGVVLPYNVRRLGTDYLDHHLPWAYARLDHFAHILRGEAP